MKDTQQAKPKPKLKPNQTKPNQKKSTTTTTVVYVMCVLTAHNSYTQFVIVLPNISLRIIIAWLCSFFLSVDANRICVFSWWWWCWYISRTCVFIASVWIRSRLICASQYSFFSLPVVVFVISFFFSLFSVQNFTMFWSTWKRIQSIIKGIQAQTASWKKRNWRKKNERTHQIQVNIHTWMWSGE